MRQKSRLTGMAEYTKGNNRVYNVCLKRLIKRQVENDTDGDTAEKSVPVVWCEPLSKHYLPPASHQPFVSEENESAADTKMAEKKC